MHKAIIRCTNEKFNEGWDKLLLSLVTGVEKGNVSVAKAGTYQLIFKLEVSRTTLLGVTVWRKTKKYLVWIANKNCSYGILSEVGGTKVPDHLVFAASQDTMQKLYDLESKVKGIISYEDAYV